MHISKSNMDYFSEPDIYQLEAVQIYCYPSRRIILRIKGGGTVRSSNILKNCSGKLWRGYYNLFFYDCGGL